jgi:hypothetical protein
MNIKNLIEPCESYINTLNGALSEDNLNIKIDIFKLSPEFTGLTIGLHGTSKNINCKINKIVWESDNDIESIKSLIKPDIDLAVFKLISELSDENTLEFQEKKMIFFMKYNL